MRRVYYMNSKRQQIVQETILQMRAANKALGPEFMSKIRALVNNSDQEHLARILTGLAPDAADASKNADDPLASTHTPTLDQEQSSADTPSIGANFEPIDQRKNLLIIMKFLQLKRDNKSVQSHVRTLLSENQTIQ